MKIATTRKIDQTQCNGDKYVLIVNKLNKITEPRNRGGETEHCPLRANENETNVEQRWLINLFRAPLKK